MAMKSRMMISRMMKSKKKRLKTKKKMMMRMMKAGIAIPTHQPVIHIMTMMKTTI